MKWLKDELWPEIKLWIEGTSELLRHLWVALVILLCVGIYIWTSLVYPERAYEVVTWPQTALELWKLKWWHLVATLLFAITFANGIVWAHNRSIVRRWVVALILSPIAGVALFILPWKLLHPLAIGSVYAAGFLVAYFGGKFFTSSYSVIAGALAGGLAMCSALAFPDWSVDPIIIALIIGIPAALLGLLFVGLVKAALQSSILIIKVLGPLAISLLFLSMWALGVRGFSILELTGGVSGSLIAILLSRSWRNAYARATAGAMSSIYSVMLANYALAFIGSDFPLFPSCVVVILTIVMALGCGLIGGLLGISLSRVMLIIPD